MDLNDTIAIRLARTAEQYGEQLAVVDSHLGLTYREYVDRVSALAERMQQCGLRPGATVVIALPRSLDYVVALGAALWAGVRALPVDPDEPTHLARPLIEAAGGSLIVTSGNFLTGLSALGIDTLAVDRERRAIAACSGVSPADDIASSADAIITSTSGSTGQPKGVVVTHAAALAGADWAARFFALTAEDCHLLKTAVNFTSVLRQWLWAVTTGGAVAILDSSKSKDLQGLARFLEIYGITITSFFPSHLELVHKINPRLSSRMRHVLIGGEPLPHNLARQVSQSSSATLHNIYGMTECNVALVHTYEPSDRPLAFIPVGRPIIGSVVELLDPAAEPGAAMEGELVVHSPLVAAGYLNAEPAAGERFLAANRDGLRGFATGDWMKCEHGEYEFVGRRDQRTKLRGYSIDLYAVEQALRTLPGIERAVCAIRRNSGSDHRLEAFVIATAQLNIPATQAAAAAQLPAYMIPSAIHLVSEFPLLASGKVDRDALLRRALFVPNVSDADVENLSGQISTAWKQLLRTAGNPEEDFFEAGGHSLLAVELSVAVAAALGFEPAPDLVYEHSTLSEYTAAVMRKQLISAGRT